MRPLFSAPQSSGFDRPAHDVTKKVTNSAWFVTRAATICYIY